MNPAEWLWRTAKRQPQSPALFLGTTLLYDYAEFARRAAALGKALQQQYELTAGDRVVIFAANVPAYLEAMYAIWWMGGVVVPVNAKLHVREAAWISAHAEAKLVLCLDDQLTELTTALAEQQAAIACLALEDDFITAAYENAVSATPPIMRKANDLTWLFYTSGTTGKPKGVMISCANLQAMAMSYFIDVDAVEAGNAAFYAAPLSHGAGLYNFMHVMKGARHILPPSRGFDADEILDLAPQLQQLSLFAAPTMVKRLVERAKQRGLRGEGIKTIVYGGGPMYLADIRQAVEVMGARFVQIYGQGECPMTITALNRALVVDRDHPRWQQRLSSVGLAQSCVQVRVVDDSGADLACGEIGEIIVSGAPVMLGYWRNEAATAQTIRDGWLYTGDLGSLDEDGFLSLHDRSKDVIISGGSNIYPREVEEVLLLHPCVQEVAVVGRASAEWGEEVVAFVVGERQADTERVLDEHCLAHIARFKRPKTYYWLDTLPKNNYGKVLKTSLRAHLTEGSTDE